MVTAWLRSTRQRVRLVSIGLEVDGVLFWLTSTGNLVSEKDVFTVH